eukprot:88088_1
MTHWFWFFILFQFTASDPVLQHTNTGDIKQNAIQLVNRSSGTYYINGDALRLISTLMVDNSFEIISLIGHARKGKSTTLNKIIQQMAASTVIAFNTSDFHDASTHGIWMYVLPQCFTDHVNTEVAVDGTLIDPNPRRIKTNYTCSQNNKSYIFLDIGGSDTHMDDESLRYAALASLISSQTFVFLHEKLYKHDVDQIHQLKTIINQILDDETIDETIDIDMTDIILGAIIREPLSHKHSDIARAVNADLSLYFDRHPILSYTIRNFRFVQEVANMDDSKYVESISNITQYLSSNKESRMEKSNANKLQKSLVEIVDQLNNNKDIKSICTSCLWDHMVQWLPYGEFAPCTEKCDGGIRQRYRKCNTGNVNDCEIRIGGTEADSTPCNTFKCEWLSFTWDNCTKECNGGTQMGYRQCSTGNAEDCKEMFGENWYEVRECNVERCRWFSMEPGSVWFNVLVVPSGVMVGLVVVVILVLVFASVLVVVCDLLVVMMKVGLVALIVLFIFGMVQGIFTLHTYILEYQADH